MSRKFDVATVLERESEAAIADWYAFVEADAELAVIPLSREDRCMHLPEMFRDLVSRLRNPLPLGTHACPQLLLEIMAPCGVIRATPPPCSWQNRGCFRLHISDATPACGGHEGGRPAHVRNGDRR
jgi:hypothetical protein